MYRQTQTHTHTHTHENVHKSTPIPSGAIWCCYTACLFYRCTAHRRCHGIRRGMQALYVISLSWSAQRYPALGIYGLSYTGSTLRLKAGSPLTTWLIAQDLMLLIFSRSVTARYMTWDCGRLLGLRVRIPPGHGCLLWVIYGACQRSLRRGWSLVQRSPTECGASECDRKTSIMRMRWPTGGCWTIKKIIGWFPYLDFFNHNPTPTLPPSQ